MNGSEILRIVDAIHRDKNIDKEIVFEGIEQAIVSAARKHFGEESDVVVDIDRQSGQPTVRVDGQELEPDEIGDLLGRIAAQTAKQVMIQKIREAERDALYDEFTALKGQIVTGAISQLSGGAATVNLGKVEGLLPRGEQVPGESHRVGERIRAIVLDVRKSGSRVKIILSRTHPEFVRRLFELEIPEVAEHVIEVRSLAREAGYRSKVAVTCYDSKIDAVGACVGVRGSRIKSIVDELAGERIDIVRWNDSLQVLVPNGLQPAEVEDVILCPMLGKVIVLVRDDQLSLAIGKKGQNVRLASKLVGWDIHVMTQARLDEQLDRSVSAFSSIPGITEELAENLVAQGFFTFDDLSVIEPDQLAELGGLSPEECETIIDYADRESLRIEQEERLVERRARAEEREAALVGSAPSATEPEVSMTATTEPQEETPAGAPLETESVVAASETEPRVPETADQAALAEVRDGESQPPAAGTEEEPRTAERVAAESSVEDAVEREPMTDEADSAELNGAGESAETAAAGHEPGEQEPNGEELEREEALSRARASAADE